MINPIAPLHARNLGATGAILGFVVSSFFLARAFTEIPSGMLCDRIGRRTPILISFGASMLGFAVCANSTNPYQLVLGRILLGFGSALFFCTGMAFVTELFDASTRGRALGIYQAIEFIGQLVGPVAGGLIASLIGLGNTYYVSLGLVLPTFFLAFFSPDLKAKASHGVISRRQEPNRYARLMNFTLAAVGISAFLRLFDESGIFSTILPVYANQFLAMDVSFIGVVLGGKAAGYIFGVMIAGFMCDNVGRKKTLLTGIMITCFALLMLGVFKEPRFLMMFSALAGVGSANIMIPLPALAVESVPQSLRGTAVGVFRTLLDLGGIVGPISMTVILDVYGPTACFSLASAAILFGALPVLFIREKT